MKEAYSHQGTGNQNWREQAIRFLLKHTTAFRDAIEHFVDSYWVQDATQEENLDLFETYQDEYLTATIS